MKSFVSAISCGLVAASLLASVPAMAASAHNSQRGSLGNSTDNAGPSGMAMRMKQMSARKHSTRRSGL